MWLCVPFAVECDILFDMCKWAISFSQYIITNTHGIIWMVLIISISNPITTMEREGEREKNMDTNPKGNAKNHKHYWHTDIHRLVSIGYEMLPTECIWWRCEHSKNCHSIHMRKTKDCAIIVSIYDQCNTELENRPTN